MWKSGVFGGFSIHPPPVLLSAGQVCPIGDTIEKYVHTKTRYLGLATKYPLVLSSSTLSGNKNIYIATV